MSKQWRLTSSSPSSRVLARRIRSISYAHCDCMGWTEHEMNSNWNERTAMWLLLLILALWKFLLIIIMMLHCMACALQKFATWQAFSSNRASKADHGSSQVRWLHSNMNCAGLQMHKKIAISEYIKSDLKLVIFSRRQDITPRYCHGIRSLSSDVQSFIIFFILARWHAWHWNRQVGWTWWKLKAGIPHIYEIFLYIYTQNILKYTYAFT